MTGLSAKDIGVRFGGLVALDRVGVDAPKGRITGLIGPNGAGKTTMFNVCSGYLTDHDGTVSLRDRDITKLSPAQRARSGLGRTFQLMQLYRSMTVRENVELACEARHVGDGPLSQLGLRGGSRRIRIEVRESAGEVLDRTGLAEVADRVVGELSTGQSRIVELARALARQPEILLLDEPSSGLDVRETRDFGDLLTGIVATDGVGILIVEHDMSLVLSICSHIYVLDFGCALMDGTPEEVRSSQLVREAYLGRSTTPLAGEGAA